MKTAKPLAVATSSAIASSSDQVMGGGLEGAQHTSRETMAWTPSYGSPDQIINPVKMTADARSQDMVQNDGYAAGATSLHRDNIVGPRYRLNAQPNWQMLGVSEEWAEEFQLIVESRFNTIAESPECWLDASRRNTFAGQIRLGVAGFVMTGEVLNTAEWIDDEPRRPFKTAVQAISPSRLSNPFGLADDQFLRRGVVLDKYGRATDYHIQLAHPAEWYDVNALKWKKVAAEKPWGRKQVLHIIDQLLPAQTRGISEMTAALKEMRMTKKFQDITLQNAVINASYAAAIESELPSQQVFEMIGANTTGGGTTEGMIEYLGAYMGALQAYLAGSKNIAIDGAKIPHLFPGTKMNMKPVGTPGGVGTGYEESLLRHISACLGLSYEEFSRDYTKTNYSSARASMNNTWKSMQTKKGFIADRQATFIYSLWLEEDIALGNLPLPPGKKRGWFYEPLVKDAITCCSWIGAARGQIDEMKEGQAAALRTQNNMSTLEIECAKGGLDWREVLKQRAREKKFATSIGMSLDVVTEKPSVEEPDNDDDDAKQTKEQ
jgi:lambda family phage portal protein